MESFKAKIHETDEQRFKDELASSTSKIERLSAILDIITDFSTQYSQEMDDKEAIELEENRLTEQRSKLGFFAGKEKKIIDEKLFSLQEKKKKLENNIAYYKQQLQEYPERSEIEEDIIAERKLVENLKTKIETECTRDQKGLSFDEAMAIYLEESDIASRVNEILYDAPFVGAIAGNTDSVLFGRYIQNEYGIPEPIEWIVLEKTDERMLLVSKYALDCQAYNKPASSKRKPEDWDIDDARACTWETSSIRKWLNEIFLMDAFSSTERNKIIENLVVADKNPEYKTNPGNNTEDKIFLLSIQEFNRYFNSDDEKKCQATEYCISRYGDFVAFDVDNNCFWLLRTPGDNSISVAAVCDMGAFGDEELHFDSCEVYNEGYLVVSILGVRPALWVKLK